MRPVVRVMLLATTLALAACATLLQPQPAGPEPWVPAYDLPEPGDGPLYPQN
jgi:hypothetical protein